MPSAAGSKAQGDAQTLKRKREVVNPKISRAEEPAFPRGGASVLTPLEHKQIQIEATRDVLFEQGTRSSKPDEEDGEAPRPKKKSKPQGKNKKGSEVAEPEEETVKIEGLSYKV